MNMTTIKPGEVAKWHCASCGKYNPLEKGMCSCGAAQGVAADAFRLNNQTTPEAKMFFEHQFPELLRELRSIAAVLGKILMEVKHD
jgi:hypothetical protein